MKRITLTAIIVFLASITCAKPPKWSAPAPLDASANFDSGDEVGLDIASDHNKRFAAVWDSYADGLLHFSISQNEGGNWTSAVTPFQDATAPAQRLHLWPSIAFAGEHRWTFAYLTLPVDTIVTRTVSVCTTNDDGLNWSPQIPLAVHQSPDTPRIASDNDGNSLVVWQHVVGGTFGEADISYSRSADGVHFTEAASIPRGAGIIISDPHLACVGKNEFLLTCYGWYASVSYTFAFHTADSGQSWTGPDVLSFPPVRVTGIYSLASDRAGNCLAAWPDSVVRSTDGGVTWSEPSPLPSGNREIKLAWETGNRWALLRTVGHDVFSMESRNNGIDWEDTSFTNTAAELPGAGNGNVSLACSPKVSVAAFSSNTGISGTLYGGDSDVFYSVRQRKPLPELNASWIEQPTITCNGVCSITANLRVANDGKSVKQFDVSFYLSDDQFLDGSDTALGQRTVDKLKTEGNFDINFTSPVPSGSSGNYLIALLDSEYQQLEQSKIDNFVVSAPIP